MQYRQQDYPQHKHTQWNQEMAVGSNRLYLFRKIQNNLQSPVHTKRFYRAKPRTPFKHNKTNETTVRFLPLKIPQSAIL
jgi:hypothetical protein